MIIGLIIKETEQIHAPIRVRSALALAPKHHHQSQKQQQPRKTSPASLIGTR
jgi:hypothetical protein